ncbi:hypothetical protein CU254_40240 [Amycolatopsis sp. AA4]|uniref:hypothetical protein n=1 Tax=Actinomycetes TaxID=1760 RepID=UPI0001B53B83|nr:MULTISPECIES: hypothetical protein [Actinomycetes]ATY15925.1 hypothetical protein CU254_40240 [Amycolatopsis sp. AA4]EFL12258.1 predicted protein [Streptomyces sp. AA4]
MESDRVLVPALRKAGALATVDYALAFAVLATAGWLLFTAEKGTHASFRFGLISIGGAAFCLVVNGVMLVRGRDRRPMFRSADAQFLATLRQGALRIWLFGLLLAAIGSGVILLVPNSHPFRPQVSGRWDLRARRAPCGAEAVNAGLFLPVPRVRNRTGQ